MKKRTEEEIKLQIEGLKKDKTKLPEFSKFGDKNWEKIDAQLDVLEAIKTKDDFWEDESAEEFEEGDNDLYFAAEEAEDWLDGAKEENLYDED